MPFISLSGLSLAHKYIHAYRLAFMLIVSITQLPSYMLLQPLLGLPIAHSNYKLFTNFQLICSNQVINQFSFIYALYSLLGLSLAHRLSHLLIYALYNLNQVCL